MMDQSVGQCLDFPKPSVWRQWFATQNVCQVSPLSPTDPARVNLLCTWPATHPTGQRRSPNSGGGGRLDASLLPGRQRPLRHGWHRAWRDGGWLLERTKRGGISCELRAGASLIMVENPARPTQLTAFRVNPPPTPSPKTLRSQISRGCYKDVKMRELAHLP